MKLVLCTHRRSIASWGLRFLMWSRWSHSAIFDDEKGLVYDSTFTHGGVKCWTKEVFFKNNPIFEIRDMNVPDDRIHEARRWLYQQLGKPYDIGALGGFVVRRNWQSDEKWFCSEFSEMFRTLFEVPRFRFKTWLITPRHQDMII